MPQDSKNQDLKIGDEILLRGTIKSIDSEHNVTLETKEGEAAFCHTLPSRLIEKIDPAPPSINPIELRSDKVGQPVDKVTQPSAANPAPSPHVPPLKPDAPPHGVTSSSKLP